LLCTFFDRMVLFSCKETCIVIQSMGKFPLFLL
jgi:hypothetical protein